MHVKNDYQIFFKGQIPGSIVAVVVGKMAIDSLYVGLGSVVARTTA